MLTVFVVALLIQVDVGLHVPDELMGQKLRLLGRPQDVFSNVTHLLNITKKSRITQNILKHID